MENEKFEAIGQRGEACLIQARLQTLSSGEQARTYTLASGERLVPLELPGHFSTLDGKRLFRLRGTPPANEPSDASE